MSNNNEKSKTTSATEIHYRILEIGASNPEKGISFNCLKLMLKSEGLISNIDNDEHLIEWFGWSYNHRELGCTCPRREKDDCGCDKDETECGIHEHFNLCRHFLRKDALVDFAQLRQSRIAQKAIKQSGEESKKAFRFAISAMIISALSLIPDFYNLIRHSSSSDIKEELSEIKSHILSRKNVKESSRLEDGDETPQSMAAEESASLLQDSSNLEEADTNLETSDE